jgi:chromosome segregation and condensation protein ScpB
MSARGQALYSGIHTGLPAPMTRVPFGQHSASREELGLPPAALKVIVAVVAADFTQVGPVSANELRDITDVAPHCHLARLERAGWVEVVGYVPRKTAKLYHATPKAWKELGLVGWSLLKEVA